MNIRIDKRCLVWICLLVYGFVVVPANCQEFEFENPVRIQAAGEVIDTGKNIAHSGPHLTDFDDDGLVDLLVGDFRGYITFYKNQGTSEQPEYAEGKVLEAEGKEIQVRNW